MNLLNIRSKEDLVAYLDQGNTVKFVFFWGHKDNGTVGKNCFSQWYEAGFDSDGHHYRSAEHYMMYKKAKLFSDHQIAEKILLAKTPGEAKSLGRSVSGFDDSAWNQNKFQLVVEANLAKFAQNPVLLEFLLATDDSVLVEASPVDTIWGIGLAQDDAKASQPKQWKGENLLGFALMEVRSQLNEQQRNI